MRALILGAGTIGRHAASAVASSGFADEIVVADLDPGVAERVAGPLGARAVAVDVTDVAALDQLLGDVDAVLHTVGPFYRFGPLVLAAAIRAGCDLVDVCDDWEPTLEMLAMGEAARAAGVTAVIGLGASPGITNLLAVQALRALDDAHTVHTGWNLLLAQPEVAGARPGAAMVHGFHQMTGTIQTWRDGAREERPLRAERIAFPGLPVGTAHTIGHPESVTLPRTHPGLTTCLNVFHAPWVELAGLRCLTGLVDGGLMDVRQAALWAERLERRAPTVEALRARLEAGRGLPPLFALAAGTHDGAPARAGVLLSASPPGGMGGATAVPAAIGLSMLHDGTLRRPGVWAPEAVVDPDVFFERFARHCGGGPVTVTSTSWDGRTVAELLRDASATA